MTTSLFADLRESIKDPAFWAYSSWLDIAVRYRRTKLGLAWVLVAFAFFVVVLGLKYAYLMGVNPHEFLPYMGAGYILWRFMVQVINDSVVTYETHRSYIMDGRVRLTDYLLRSIAKSSLYFMLAMIVLTVVFAWSSSVHISNLLWLLLSFPLIVINMMWVSVCVSFFGARYPDTQEFVGTVLMAGLLLTPILWDVSKFPVDTTRGMITRLNPAFHLIEVARAPMLGKMPESLSVIAVVLMALVGWLTASIMYRRLARHVPLWV